MAGKHTFVALRIMAALAWLLGWWLAPAAPAQADNVVTNCTENGLDAALGPGTVTFNCGGHHLPATIAFITPMIFTSDITIDGSNGGNLVALEAISNTVIFSVTNGASLALSNLVLLSSGSTVGDGGCLYTNSALRLNNVEVKQCHAAAGHRGGALYVDSAGSAEVVNSSLHDNSAGVAGGAIYSLAALTITASTLEHNAATTADGGGLWAIGQTRIDGSTFYSNTAPNGYGGGLYNQGTLSMTNSVLSANQAGLGGGGLQTYLGTTALTGVTLSGNSARSSSGGGISDEMGTITVMNAAFSGNSAGFGGGGMFNHDGVLTATNATFSGNSAHFDGGGIGNIHDAGIGAMTLANATLSGNLAHQGGGIYNIGATSLTNVTLNNMVDISGTADNLYAGDGVLTLTSSIVTFNALAGGFNCFGAGSTKLVSGGYNLASDTSCGLLHFGDQQPANALLGPLVYNGGPRTGAGGDPLLTQLPGASGPAIDEVPLGVNGCGTTLITDERGAPRPINHKCDIGAVEAGWVYAQLWLAFVRR